MLAPVTYIPDLVYKPVAAMDLLWSELPWENREGAPRRECWFNPYGQPYTYGSGEFARTYEAHSLDVEFSTKETPASGMIAAIMVKLNERTGANYDCCFVNGYAHGRQHLGWHADDSPEMDQDHPIATVSLGAAREIWFRAWDGPEDQWLDASKHEKLLLESGSAAIMHAGMQRDWQHRIPKSPLGDACPPRISLTYRKLVR